MCGVVTFVGLSATHTMEKPGAACIAIYLAGDIIAKGFPFSGFFSLWLTAIATAIFSIFFYGRFPFRDVPWFVALNLFINIPGLLFSILALVAYF